MSLTRLKEQALALLLELDADTVDRGRRQARASADVRSYPGGQTACENLCCLCRSHHRLKTFAPGWHFRIDDDGTLHVTTPSGVTRTTRPPGRIEHDLHTAAVYSIPDPPPEPWPPRGSGSPTESVGDPRSPEPPDDPPPF